MTHTITTDLSLFFALRRRKGKNLPAPVLAEPNCEVASMATLKQGGEARESTRSQNRVAPDERKTRGGQTFKTEGFFLVHL